MSIATFLMMMIVDEYERAACSTQYHYVGGNPLILFIGIIVLYCKCNILFIKSIHYIVAIIVRSAYRTFFHSKY